MASLAIMEQRRVEGNEEATRYQRPSPMPLLTTCQAWTTMAKLLDDL